MSNIYARIGKPDQYIELYKLSEAGLQFGMKSM